MVFVKVNGENMDLKERLICNVSKLMDNGDYTMLVDYNRGLFYELYDLDIFNFIDKNIVDEYCRKHSTVCRKHLL